MTAQNTNAPRLDTEWFKTLYDYGAVGNFRREINDLIKEMDPTTSPDWPQVSEWGRELLPNEPLFKKISNHEGVSVSISVSSGELSLTPDEAGEALIDSSMFKKISGQTQLQRECELAKFRELCGDYFGRKIAQARVYAELDDVPRAATLLVEVLRKGPKHYQLQVMELLEELDSEMVIEAMANKNHVSMEGIKVSNAPKSIGVLGDVSERFDMLTDDDANRHLILAHIYMEIGDTNGAKEQIAASVQAGEHKTNPLVKELATELGVIKADESAPEIPQAAMDACTESGMHELLSELSSCFNRVGRDEHAKKLALAYFYIKLHDHEMARKYIIDVLDEGEEKHRKHARELNKKLKAATG